MKVKKSVSMICAMLVMSSIITVRAADVPQESLPCYATYENVAVIENLIPDILDKVKGGLGYADAVNEANNRILKAVLEHKTNGYGYAILSEISSNAIYQYRDMYLRPDYYEKAEAVVYNLIADLIADTANGKDYEETRKEAYARIYMAESSAYDPGSCYMTDFCYWDTPPTDYAKFTIARKLLLNAKNCK